MPGMEAQRIVEQKPEEIEQEAKKAARKIVEQPVEGTGLGEIQQRAVMAYAAYIEAEREVERAYRDQQQKIEKAYLGAREKARKTCEESVAQTLNAREEAEEKARKTCEESVAQALSAREEAEGKARKACEEKVALAMKAREEAELKSLEARNEGMEQSWDIFTKSKK